MIKPHRNVLLYQVCSPNILLTPNEIYLFECDPHKFMKHQKSPLTHFYDPGMNAINLKIDLVKHHGKDTNQGLLGLLMGILSCYSLSAWFLSPNNYSTRRKSSRIYMG